MLIRYFEHLLQWLAVNLGLQLPEWLEQSLDSLDYHLLSWLLWLFMPLVMAFVLPIGIVIVMYASILFLHIYKARHRLADAYYSSGMWDWARMMIATFWEVQGNIWHGKYKLHVYMYGLAMRSLLIIIIIIIIITRLILLFSHLEGVPMKRFTITPGHWASAPWRVVCSLCTLICATRLNQSQEPLSALIGTHLPLGGEKQL